MWEIGIKAISSVHQERKVKDIIEVVRIYIQNSTFYRTARAGRVNLGDYLYTIRSRCPQHELRTVLIAPFERAFDYVDRAGIIVSSMSGKNYIGVSLCMSLAD